ncbi:MAG: hypothetical protein IKS19_06905 [Clostridia bacterium]|nr:hypothetical protein [Clostridia bacterium]
MKYREYPNRFCDDPKVAYLMCNHCIHRIKGDLSGPKCKAFPDGIPRDLMLREEHDTPYPGDNGYRFLKKEE